MLALNDDAAFSPRVTKVDTQITPGLEGLENNSVSRLNQVAGELLKVMRRELFEIVVRHQSGA